MKTKKKIFSGGQHSQILPDDIIVSNILSRFDVKSLSRWKLVSKTWRSFIEDPVFVDQIRYNTRLQWVRLPPIKLPEVSYTNVQTGEVHEKYDMDVHIYSVNHSGGGASTEAILERYVPPRDQFFQKQYSNSLVCSYGDSSQLTVFNTTTKESLNVSLPSPFPFLRHQWFRNFEYGFDPLSKKYKVLTYNGGRAINFDPIDGSCIFPWNFQVLTLGEETLTWRSLECVPKIEFLPQWVTIANGKLFWFLLIKSRKSLNSSEWLETAKIISFNLATEKFTTISPPESQVHSYFKRPLFDFEGSLCYVENICIGKQETSQFLINVWMLKDPDISDWVSIAKTMVLSLDGTKLEILGTRYFDDGSHSTLEDVEFSMHNGKLVVAAYDNKDQYVYGCSVLNGQCKRMKITGRPFKHPTIHANTKTGNNAQM